MEGEGLGMERLMYQRAALIPAKFLHLVFPPCFS